MLLEQHAPEVQRIAQRLRTLVKDVVPDAEERVYPSWHALGYRHPRARYFCGIFPHRDHVKLGFEWGALLRDEEGLLEPGPSGGTRVRYVTCASLEELPEGPLVALLLEAIDLRSRRRPKMGSKSRRKEEPIHRQRKVVIDLSPSMPPVSTNVSY